MPSKKDGLIVIYPDYFRKGLTRKEGRRVPKAISLDEVNLDKLVRICKKMGLTPEVQQGAAYPGRWFERSGRILLQKTDIKISKQALLTKLATRMAKGADQAATESSKSKK
jgi:signal recognition particle subunit SRP19